MSDLMRQVGLTLIEARDRFVRWVEIEQAEFVGGVLDGERMPVGRGTKEWVQPHAEGSDTYRRAFTLFSGPVFTFESHRPVSRLAHGGIVRHDR